MFLDEGVSLAGVSPVTMEDVKFEIPEGPIQPWPERSPMEQFSRIIFETFQKSPKKKCFLAGILANIGLRNFQADLGLDAAQFRVTPQTSFDEINDRVVYSERGDLVRVSDSHLVHRAHSTARDLW